MGISVSLPANLTSAKLAGSSIVALILYRYLKTSSRKLPPGPKRLPLLGSVLNMPTSQEWLTFGKWSQVFGSDFVYAEALGTSMLILNSYESAKDLLEKRSTIYSSRPHFTMLHELCGWGYLFSLLPYGDTWRTSRKMFTKHFAPANRSLNEPRETLFARRLLGQLLLDPDNVLEHARYYVSAVALSMTYGVPIQPKNDPFIDLAEEAMRSISEIFIPGAFLVDTFPVMKHIPKWFPGAGFHRKAEFMNEHSVKIREAPFKATEDMMNGGKYEASFVSEALSDMEGTAGSGSEKALLKDVAGLVFLASADTTTSALGTFFLAMVCYPDIQRKAQAELDRVVQGRLPDHGDLDSLPYLQAVVREVYRWRPSVPLGVPHFTTSDDVYKGYYIPKNTIVMANQWAMCFDEKDFPDPETFNPERYLKDGKINPSVRDPADIVFGFGRRACPGKHIGHSMIMLAAACVLSTYDLLKQTGEKGEFIEPTKEYHLGAMCHPKKFPCRIVPRSEEAGSLVRSLTEELM